MSKSSAHHLPHAAADASETRPAATAESESKSFKILREIFESGRPLMYIRSSEEQRVASLLRDAAQQFFSSPVPVWTWSSTEGMRRDGAATAGESLGARAALDFVAAHDGAAIFHFKDFHAPLRESAEVRRRLRDLYDVCFDKRKFVVISSPVQYVPEDLARNVVFIELSVPDLAEMALFLRREAAVLAAAGATVDTSEATLYQLARSLQGLTIDEARHALRRAVAERHAVDQTSVPILLEEKRLLVNRTGMIEYVADGTGIEQVGGLEILKKWLLERRKLFQLRDSLSADSRTAAGQSDGDGTSARSSPETPTT